METQCCQGLFWLVDFSDLSGGGSLGFRPLPVPFAACGKLPFPALTCYLAAAGMPIVAA